MKCSKWTLAMSFAACSAIALAQGPGGPNGPIGQEGRRGPGGPGGPGGGPPPSPIVEALDADRDGVISAEELQNATEALSRLDRNEDGQLSGDEIHPTPMDRGPDVPRGPAPTDRPRRPDQVSPDQRGPDQRGPDQRGPDQRGPAPRDRAPQRPDRPDGFERPEGPGGPGDFGRPPGPDPERMLEHAMQCDADEDGKLSPDELRKFIAEFIEMHPGPGGPDGFGPGGPGPGGREGRGAGGPDGGDRGPAQSGARPDRPRRPDQN